MDHAWRTSSLNDILGGKANVASFCGGGSGGGEVGKACSSAYDKGPKERKRPRFAPSALQRKPVPKTVTDVRKRKQTKKKNENKTPSSAKRKRKSDVKPKSIKANTSVNPKKPKLTVSTDGPSFRDLPSRPKEDGSFSPSMFDLGMLKALAGKPSVEELIRKAQKDVIIDGEISISLSPKRVDVLQTPLSEDKDMDIPLESSLLKSLQKAGSDALKMQQDIGNGTGFRMGSVAPKALIKRKRDAESKSMKTLDDLPSDPSLPLQDVMRCRNLSQMIGIKQKFIRDITALVERVKRGDDTAQKMVLINGPPGCGKTAITTCISKMLGFHGHYTDASSSARTKNEVDALLNRMRNNGMDCLDKKGFKTLVVMDEADGMGAQMQRYLVSGLKKLVGKATHLMICLGNDYKKTSILRTAGRDVVLSMGMYAVSNSRIVLPRARLANQWLRRYRPALPSISPKALEAIVNQSNGDMRSLYTRMESWGMSTEAARSMKSPVNVLQDLLYPLERKSVKTNNKAEEMRLEMMVNAFEGLLKSEEQAQRMEIATRRMKKGSSKRDILLFAARQFFKRVPDRLLRMQRVEKQITLMKSNPRRDLATTEEAENAAVYLENSLQNMHLNYLRPLHEPSTESRKDFKTRWPQENGLGSELDIMERAYEASDLLSDVDVVRGRHMFEIEPCATLLTCWGVPQLCARPTGKPLASYRYGLIKDNPFKISLKQPGMSGLTDPGSVKRVAEMVGCHPDDLSIVLGPFLVHTERPLPSLMDCLKRYAHRSHMPPDWKNSLTVKLLEGWEKNLGKLRIVKESDSVTKLDAGTDKWSNRRKSESLHFRRIMTRMKEGVEWVDGRWKSFASEEQQKTELVRLRKWNEDLKKRIK